MVKKMGILLLLIMTIMVGNGVIGESNITVAMDDNDSNNSDSFNHCLAISKKDLQFCIKIKNRDDKSSCFGIVKRDTGYCTMIKNKNIQNRCLAITLSNPQYCNRIKDKEMRKDCMSLYADIESENYQKECKGLE